MFREWDRTLGLVGHAELNSGERRRAIRRDDLIQAQLAQRRPAARHQALAAWFISRKSLLVHDDDAMSSTRGKKSGSRSRRSRAHHRDVSVGAGLAWHEITIIS